MFIIIIETIQFLFKTGIFDIDDVIINALSCYGVVIVIDKHAKKHNTKIAISLYSIFTILLFLFVIIEESYRYVRLK